MAAVLLLVRVGRSSDSVSLGESALAEPDLGRLELEGSGAGRRRSGGTPNGIGGIIPCMGGGGP